MTAWRRAHEGALGSTKKALRALETGLNTSPPTFDQEVAEHCRTAVSGLLRLEQHYERKLASLPKPKPGVSTDSWNFALLSELAKWWWEQGWKPTTTTESAFTTTARLVMGFRQGTDEPIDQINHKLLIKALRDGTGRVKVSRLPGNMGSLVLLELLRKGC